MVEEAEERGLLRFFGDGDRRKFTDCFCGVILCALLRSLQR